jgi:hypothetical protein
MLPLRPTCAALFWLATSSVPAASVKLTARSHPLALEIVAMRGIDRDRLLILTPQEVLLVRLKWPVVDVRGRLRLPEPQRPARTSAGLISLLDDPTSCWLLLNTATHAQLVSLDGDELSLGSQAERLPWPDLPGGVAFRPGTNIVEIDDAALAGSPLVSPPASAGSPALTDAARLLLRDAAGRAVAIEGPLIGPPLLPIAPGIYAATSARPPSEPDAILLLNVREDSVETVATLSVEGVVTALARLPNHGAAISLVAAIRVDGGVRLLLCELRP